MAKDEGTEIDQEELDIAPVPDCCEAAAEKGGECDHACCVEARLAGEICATCAG